MADVITRLKLESGEYDSKIRRAVTALQQMEAGCRKVGGSLAVLEKDQKDYVQSLGRMETVSTSVRGKIGELTNAYTELAAQYRRLTDEEKKGDFGKALSSSLSQLKQRITDSKAELNEISKELSGAGSKGIDLSGAMQTLGSKFGISSEALSMLSTGTVAYTAVLGGLTTAVIAGTKAWADYNAELAKQDQITTVTTGLKGDDANRMTDKARALSDTYGVDFRETINAANTLMTQFGQSGEQAMQLIKDGMQGMIKGDGPKLLSMIQQYAPAFRDAGVSASQLVAVIQNSEGGIFTDQNMNAIVMGIKNIRLMTKPTSDALAQLGIDGQKMSQQLNDGTLTVFDALKQVASAIEGVDSNSKAAGEVMQQVFGRQGAMAGTKLGEAIATLNTNLEETKKQTGEVGDALADLQTANERLNTAIREAFGYDGWEQMATGIKTKLIGALADVIEHLAIIEEGFGKISKFFGGGGNKPSGIGYKDVKDAQTWINNGKDDNERRRRYDKAIADLQKKLNNVGKERAVRNSDGSTSYIVDDEETQAQKRAAIQKRMKMLFATSYTEETKIKPNKPIPGSGGGKNTITEEKGDFTEIIGLIGNAQERVSDLQRQIRESWDQNEIVNLRKKLKDAQNELDVLQGKLPKDTVVDITVDANTAEALQKIGNIEGVTIEPKTFDITATDEAMPKLRDIEGVTIDPKTSVITATDEAMPKLRDIDGVTIEPKNMTVTADTTEALQRVQELIAQVNGTVVGIKVEPIKVEPGSLKAYQEQLKESQSDLQVMREDLLRLKEGGAEPMEIAVKEDEIQDAIDNISTIEKKIDELNGKTAKTVTWEQGLSGFNEQTISAWTSMIKSQLAKEDIGSALYSSLMDNMSDMSRLTNTVQDAIKLGLDIPQDSVQEMFEQVFDQNNLPADMYNDMIQKFINDFKERTGQDLKVGENGSLSAGKEDKKRENGLREVSDVFSKLGGGLNQVSSGLQQLGVQMPKEVDELIGTINAVGSVISGIQTVISLFGNGAMAANTAAVIANTAAMVVNSGVSILPYAGGGVVHAADGWVGGNRYSGDQIPAMLNSGEVVLNRAQVGNLAAQLEGGDFGNMQLEATIYGEDIKLALNNNGKRTQKGEFVQSRRRY